MKHNWRYKNIGDITISINGLWTGKKPPFVRVGVIRNTNFTKDCKLDASDIFYTDVEIRAFQKRKLEKGDIIVEKSGGSEKQPVGRPILFNLDGDFSFSNFTATLRLTDSNVLPDFFHKALYGLYLKGETRRLQSRTTGLYNLNWKEFLKLNVPVPPMEVQEKIVAELDGINTQIDRCRQLLHTLESLATSLFYDTFGDPVSNPKEWKIKTLDEISKVLSDGPFGSNLKSDHYRETGVRVIRLQNIGSGIFIDKDKAFVDEGHYDNISKYTCYPGEVVIGTLGMPNLRACLVPKSIDKAIHKADCVRCVPKKDIANALFISALLNTQSILNEASKNIHGATRARISAGQLKQLKVILPPLSLQEQFAKQIEAIEAQKSAIEMSIEELQILHDSRMDYWFN